MGREYTGHFPFFGRLPPIPPFSGTHRLLLRPPSLHFQSIAQQPGQYADAEPHVSLSTSMLNLTPFSPLVTSSIPSQHSLFEFQVLLIQSSLLSSSPLLQLPFPPPPYLRLHWIPFHLIVLSFSRVIPLPLELLRFHYGLRFCCVLETPLFLL